MINKIHFVLRKSRNQEKHFKTIALIGAAILLFSQMTYAQIGLQAISSLERVLNSSDSGIHGTEAAKIYAARNEAESFQVVISAKQKALKNVRIVMTELKSSTNDIIDKDHIQLYREIPVLIRNSSNKAVYGPGLFPDPLVPFVNPYTGNPTNGGRFLPQGFSIWEGQSESIWVDVEVPVDAKPGIYTGRIDVSANGVPSASIQVELTIWNFTLPDGPTHSNHFGNFSRLAGYYNTGDNPEIRRELEMRYIQLLAAHRLNPPFPEDLIPSTNDDGSINITEKFDQDFTDFITKYHVTDIDVPRTPFRYPFDRDRTNTINYYRSWYQYLTKKGWEDRAYLYMQDEPNSSSDYRAVREMAKLVEEAVPELRRLVVEQPYTQDPQWGTLNEAIDIWCPLFGFIEESSIEKVKKEGDEVWSYTALIQNAPLYHPNYQSVKNDDPPYWEIDFPLTAYRVSTWLNKRYGITGLLYWTTVQWASDKRNPWDDPAFRNSFNGGGQLIYPGEEAGINGPIATIRLKALRDAMDDYEYFTILEKKGKNELVNELVKEVVPDWGSWVQNPQIYLDLRRKMGEAISADN